MSGITELDPGIRPPMKMIYRVLLWLLVSLFGVSLFLVLWLGPLAYLMYTTD
jgi:hypothetical protein